MPKTTTTNIITQTLLQEYDLVNSTYNLLDKRRRNLRARIIKAIETGASTEPGALKATLERRSAGNLTRRQLEELLGAEESEGLFAAVGKWRYLMVEKVEDFEEIDDDDDDAEDWFDDEDDD